MKRFSLLKYKNLKNKKAVKYYRNILCLTCENLIEKKTFNFL